MFKTGAFDDLDQSLVSQAVPAPDKFTLTSMTQIIS